MCALVWLQIKFWPWNNMSWGHAWMGFTAPSLQYEGQFGEGQKLFSSLFWSWHSLYLSLFLYLPSVSKEHGCVLPLLNSSNFLFFIWKIIVALLPSLISQNMFSFGSDGSVCTNETQCSETSHEFYSHAIRFWKLITHCYREEKHLKKSMENYTQIRSSERFCKFIKPYKYKMSFSKGQSEHLPKAGKSWCK